MNNNSIGDLPAAQKFAVLFYGSSLLPVKNRGNLP